MDNILENYLNNIQLNDNSQNLTEDVKAVVDKLKSMNIKKVVHSLTSAAEMKNKSKIKSILNSIKLPGLSVEKVENDLNKKPEFKRSVELSKKVIKNSVPNLPDKNVDAIAFGVALKSMKSNQPMDETKKNLINTVGQLRRYIGGGAPSESNFGTVIVIIYIIGSILSSAFLGASFYVLLGVGALLLMGQVILD